VGCWAVPRSVQLAHRPADGVDRAAKAPGQGLPGRHPGAGAVSVAKQEAGIQATHLALALSIAGIIGRAEIYIGSWSDWITSPDRPIVLG
jgi:3-mercaptopyruvate sulfurtransferase SseA